MSSQCCQACKLKAWRMPKQTIENDPLELYQQLNEEMDHEGQRTEQCHDIAKTSETDDSLIKKMVTCSMQTAIEKERKKRERCSKSTENNRERKK